MAALFALALSLVILLRLQAATEFACRKDVRG